jgi:hypothetical protein
MITIASVSLRRLFSICFLVVLLCGQVLTVTPTVQAASSELTKAALSTVLILALDRNDDVLSRGSGALIAENGLVLTNYHVIADNRRRDGRVMILVPNQPTPSQLEDFTPYLGLILSERSNPDADLALVQIDQTFDAEPLPADTTFPALTLGDSTGLSVDEEIHILGYPRIGGGATLITIPGQIIGMNKENGLPWLLTNATIASGNSGGVVLNQAGELVAIPTMTANDERSGNTIGYLRPIQLAYPLINDDTNPTATNDRIFCADDFTSNKNGWPLGFDEDDLLISETVLTGGVYQKFVHFQQDAYTWANAPDCEVKHFYLQVDATVRHVSDTDTGIVLLLRNRERQDDNDHYRVIFYLDRSFELDVYHEGEWQTLQERTNNRQLTLADGETHQLGVLLVGGQLTVYVNGQEIASVFDETLTGTGGVGLGLVGNTDQEIEVAFDNFVVERHTAPGVLFYDFFIDNHNEWPLSRINNADVDCEDKIVNGRLEHHLTAKTKVNVCYSSAPELLAQDFWLQIDTIWLQRYVEGSWLEIAFRHDEATGQQYTLRLSQDGYYLLEKYDQGEWHTLQEWTKSAAIKRGRGQINTVNLWVRGPYITLMVNDVELITVEDDQLIRVGQINPGIGGDTGVSTAIAFDNLIVRETPPPAE